METETNKYPRLHNPPVFSKQFTVESAPFPACITAEALCNQLAETAGEGRVHACIVFSGGKAEFYYDEADAAGVAKSVFRQVRKNHGFARRLQKDFNAHIKVQADFCKTFDAKAGGKSLADSIEQFASNYAETEAYAFLYKFSLPLLEQAARECLEAHLPKKGREDKIAEILSGKPRQKENIEGQPQETQPAVEAPPACAPYIDALPLLRKIGAKAQQANSECLSASDQLLGEAAKRLKLKPDEIGFFLPAEIASQLKDGRSMKEVARERMRYCIFSQKEAFSTFYVGGNAKVFGRQVLGLPGDRTANK